MESWLAMDAVDTDYTTPGTTNWSTMPSAEVIFMVKDPAMRAVVGASCCLSILGSLLIILSYILFKNRRTRAREILLHISLMDMGVALANLIGLSVYFDQFYYISHHTHHPVPSYIDGLCKTQAFFATYCTYASILWTIALAAFLYFVIMHNKTKKAVYFVCASYVICYGIPLLLSLWLIFTKKLGHSPLESSGWCTLITDDLQTRKVDIFINVFAYDLWIILAIVTIPLFYLAIRCHLASEVRQLISPERFWSSLHHVDYKFLIIPVVFVFLRVWSIIMSILYDYIQLDVDQVPSQINLALLYLSGIGDSSQGFANAILFVIFTKNIRDSFIKCLCCGKTCKNDENLEAEGQIQNTRSNQSSRLSLISGDSRRASPVAVTAENSQDEEEEERSREKVSLVFGGSGSNLKAEQSHRYGAVS